MAHIKICKEMDCQNAATSKGYCRLHYLRNWRQLRELHKQSAARRLNRYIEHVCKENPQDYLEKIREDLQRPDFHDYVDEHFGGEEGTTVPLEDQMDDEEIERLIRKLKIEEGF